MLLYLLACTTATADGKYEDESYRVFTNIVEFNSLLSYTTETGVMGITESCTVQLNQYAKDYSACCPDNWTFIGIGMLGGAICGQ